MSKTTAIFQFVSAAGHATRFEIYVIFGKVRQALNRMVHRRELKCRDGVYTPGDTYTRPGAVAWTEAELAVLSRYYADGADRVQKRLPHRTIDSINKMASRFAFRGKCGVPRQGDPIGKLLRTTHVPAYATGNLSPMVHRWAA